MQYWKKSVPAHIIKHLSEKSTTIDTLYTEGRFEFDTDTSSQRMKPVVWENATNLLDSVIDHRKIIGNILIKVMADGQQGYFKLNMTVLPEDYSDENQLY